jgi:hypothetical protein
MLVRGGVLLGVGGKDGGVADPEVLEVVAAALPIHHRGLGVAAHAGGADPMVGVDDQGIGSDAIGAGVDPASAGADDLFAGLDHVFCHGDVAPFVMQVDAGHGQAVAVPARWVEVHELLGRDQQGALHVHAGVPGVALAEFALEGSAVPRHVAHCHPVGGDPGAALHRIGAFKLRVGPVPVEPGKQRVVVVGAVVVRQVAAGKFGKVADDGQAEVAAQVPPDLPGGVSQLADQKLAGGLDRPASQDEVAGLQALFLTLGVEVLDSRHLPAGAVRNQAGHHGLGENGELAGSARE